MAFKKLTRKEKTNKTHRPTSPDFQKLKLLITVINRKKTEFFLDYLSGFEVNFQTSMLAKGTAHSETLSLLGLEDDDRAVLFSVIQEDKAESALNGLSDKFKAVKNGKGIAFTVPLSSVIGVSVYQFLSNNKQANTEVK